MIVIIFTIVIFVIILTILILLFNLRGVAQVQGYLHSVNINHPDSALCDNNILHIVVKKTPVLFRTLS